MYKRQVLACKSVSDRPVWVTFTCDENGRTLSGTDVLAALIVMQGMRVDAFHYKDRDGVIVRHDTLVPSFTDLKPGSELFQIVTVEAGEDPADFCRRAKAQAAAQTEFITSGPWDGDQLVYFTCLPWFPLTALKLSLIHI